MGTFFCILDSRYFAAPRLQGANQMPIQYSVSALSIAYLRTIHVYVSTF